MHSLNSNGRFLFVYLPTRFGFSSKQTNTENRLKYKNKLDVNDLYYLEKDYRNSLIKYLKEINEIEVINISTIAKDNWFFDESHYSPFGHQEIANNLINNFLQLLN